MTPEEHALADRIWGLAEPEPSEWRSGPWSIEVRGDELADLRFDGEHVLRAVRAVARDRDWGTVPVEVVSAERDDVSLILGLRMRGLGAELDGTLRVAVDGRSLTIAFDAVNHADFLGNRVGLVVLHPPSVAGAPLVVTHPDGSRTETFFPAAISPHQPAFDIAALEWPAGGVGCELAFSGEVFEMEDQRNWTDASFKTYSTPLALPFPVLLPAGEHIAQTLTVTADGAGPTRGHEQEVDVRLEETAGPVPAIVLGASTAPDPAPANLPALGSALLVELDLGTPSWRAALDRALTDAAGLPLDVRIVASAAPEAVEGADLTEVVAALAGVPLVHVAVFDADTHVSERALVDRLRAALGDSDIPVAGGARSHFTELNRTHERLPDDLDAVTFSVTPQMHATERSQLVESIAMQREVARNAVRIAGDAPVVVGPITLKARFNAVATSGGPTTSPQLTAGYGAELSDATDVRQASPALAAWTIASAAASSVPGVAALCYFERWGARGVVAADGTPYPVLEAVEALAELAGSPLLTAADAGRSDVWVLGARRDAAIEVLVANLAPRAQTVRISAPGVDTVSIEVAALDSVRRTLPASG